MTGHTSPEPLWTTADIPSLQGRNIVITGANSGIGYQAAVTLAGKGASVILACRDPGRATSALAALRRAVPDADVRYAPLDLGSLASIKAFAEGILTQGLSLHCLINNAGVMAPPRRLETKDGFELQFGTNVLGHFALTAQLFPALRRAASEPFAHQDGAIGPFFPRIITLASIAHKRGSVSFDDLQSRRAYSPMKAYAQSKLCDLILALELDRRLRASGEKILSIAVHPGVASTNLFRTGDYHGVEKWVRNALGPVIGLVLNSDSEGALPTLFAATAKGVEGGGYYGPQGVFEARGKGVGPAKIAAQARDPAVAKQLWETCETLCGLRFP